MAADPGDQGLDHAWKWFALHAAQRMQTFNFFLIATAFLVAAYASLLEKNSKVAVIIALVGAWIAFWFTRLDNRTRQLIQAAENPIRIFETRLAQETNIPELNILAVVERPIAHASRYRTVIVIIEWTVVVIFVGGAIYAGYLAGAVKSP